MRRAPTRPVGACFVRQRCTVPKVALETPHFKGILKGTSPAPNWENLLTDLYRNLDAATPIRFTALSCKRQKYYAKSRSSEEPWCSQYTAFCGITCLTRMSRETWQQDVTTIMQPFHCDLHAQLPKHLITTHTQAHPKVTAREQKTPKGPHPRHTQAALHHRLQPLYPKKLKVSCPGFLPKANPMQHPSHMATERDYNHAAIPLRSATTDSKTP